MRMTYFRQIGDLHFNQQRSNREIADLLCIGAATVSMALTDIRKSGRPWSELETMRESELQALLRPNTAAVFLEPDFALYDKKLRRQPKLTMLYFYNELYLQADNPSALPLYSYTRFCALFNAWSEDHHGHAALNVPPFGAAQVAEIDFSGDPMPYCDHFGQIRQAQIFVLCLRCSKMLYAEAMPDQTASSWLLGSGHGLRALGGAPMMLSIDNARALVAKPDEHVGGITAAFKAFCQHYHIEALTNRVHDPKGKQAVEYGCGRFQEKIQAPMTCDGPVFADSLEELNAKIKVEVDKFNKRPFTDRGLGSRLSLFEREERPLLAQLPETDFQNYKWSVLTADKYHWVKKNGRRWMVQYFMAGKQVVCASSLTSLKFYSMSDGQEVGSCDLTKIDLTKPSVERSEYLSPAEQGMRRGCPGMRELFAASHHLTERIDVFLKSIFDRETVYIAQYKLAVGLHGLCRKHGITLVDEACAELEKRGALNSENYGTLRQIINEKIGRINDARSQRRQKAKAARRAPSTCTASDNHLFYKK